MQRFTFDRRHVVAAAIVITLGCAAVAMSQAPGQRGLAAPPAVPGGLWIADASTDHGGRLLIVVDPATRHMAVYHVDPATGGLALKSARDITWDLSLDEFNAQEPRPAAIRQMLQSPPTVPAPREP